MLLGKRHTGGGRPWLTGSIKRAAIHNRALSDAEILASFQSDGESISQAEAIAQLTELERKEYESIAENLRTTREQLAALDKAANAVSYAGTRVQPEPTRRLKRGEVNSPAEVVTPGGLSAITTLASDWGLEPHSNEALRRLKFAEWLTDPRNPLPARVIVNRVWYHHFGRGIVFNLERLWIQRIDAYASRTARLARFATDQEWLEPKVVASLDSQLSNLSTIFAVQCDRGAAGCRQSVAMAI